jgi:hypothetical protein
MHKKFFWKIWLRPNPLTGKTGDDYVAGVDATGPTLRNEDIARRIVEAGSEYHYESLVDLLGRRDALVREALLKGIPVQDANVHLFPRILGKWTGAHPHYDPLKHKITFSAAPTASMRTAFREEVGIDILGSKPDGGAYIDRVTDTETGLVNSVLTPNGGIIIQGTKIKITPTDTPATGIFFINEEGEETRVEGRLIANGRHKLIARIPLLPEGRYTLKITTHYTGFRPLQLPRDIFYPHALRVGPTPTP